MKATVQKETKEERKQQLRGKWCEKLWIYPIASSEMADVGTRTVYLLTPDRSFVHRPKIPGVIRWPQQAFLIWPVFDACAAFFEKHPSSKWLLMCAITNGLSSKGKKIAPEKIIQTKVIAWG